MNLLNLLTGCSRPVDKVRFSGRIPAVFVERKICQRSINWYGKIGFNRSPEASLLSWRNVRKSGVCAFWCVRCRQKSRIPLSEKSRGCGFPMGRKLLCTYPVRDILWRNSLSCRFVVVAFGTCRAFAIRSFGERRAPPVSMVESKHEADMVQRKIKRKLS